MKFFNNKELLQKKLNDLRNSYSCVWDTEGIKSWEYLFLIFGCYLKEIIETLVATFNTNSQLSSLAASSYPLNMELFWIIVFKSFLGIVILVYFHYRYVDKTIILFILAFWLFSVGNSLLSTMSTMSSFGSTWKEIMEFFNIAIQAFIFVFFFGIDKSNIDAFKLLIYDQLEEDPFSGRIYKSPWSKISSVKITRLVSGIFAITMSMIFFVSMIFTIIKWIISSTGTGTRTRTNKNQQQLENIAKTNMSYIAFSSIIIAPVIEEVIFRKCLMQMNNYKWWTSLVSAFIFGIIHLHNEPLWSIFPYLIPGLVFSIIMFVSKNIWFSILSHSLFNVITFINMAIKIKTQAS